jgi:sodium-dependent dicarboxylate transporter 2/3/5
MTPSPGEPIGAIGEIVIDRRPLWRIVLAQSRRPALVAFGLGIFIYTTWLMPSPDGLSIAGQRSLGVFLVCLLFWVFNVLPLMITGVLALVLLPLSGAVSSGEVYGLFGNEALFFVLGVFLLSAALMHCGLTTRIAVAFLRWFGHTPRTLLLSVYLLNALMSCIMPEHAVAAMTFPIIMEIAAALRLPRRRSNYGRALFVAMAWGTTIGGIATLLGSARTPLAIGILRESIGQTIGFSQWTVAAWPVAAGVLALGYLVIAGCFPIDVTSIREAQAVLAEKALRLDRPSPTERAIGGLMLATLLAWILVGEAYGLANIALVAIVAMFLFALVRWRDLEGYVNWGTLLMYGGAINLGAALNASGAAGWVAASTISRIADGGPSIVLVLSATTIILSEAMNSSAVVALFMPVAVGLAEHAGMDPAVLVPAVAIPAGLGFMLPIATPANAMAYSSGYLSVRDLLVPSTIMIVGSLIVFNLVANWYWPLVGFSLQP